MDIFIKSVPLLFCDWHINIEQPVNEVGYWLYRMKVTMGKSARLNMIKSITNFIKWLLSLSGWSVKYIVSVSFDYIVRLIFAN